MNALEQFTPLIDAVVYHINEGVILTDYKGKVLFHNPAADELLGHPDFESVANLGLNSENSSANVIPQLENNNHVLTRHGEFDQCSFVRRVEHQGKTRYLQINTSTVPVPGKADPLQLLVMADITVKHRLEGILNDNAQTGIITQDPRMLEIAAKIEQIAPTRASALIQGESGTGKSLLARMLHQKSDRSDKPLVELNCAAIPEALLESELFGHVKGAFTGAIQDRMGRFQTADGGTLFLDEISELPLHLQPKLLKALEEQSFQMVGSDQNVQVDVRVVAASNQNLRELVDAGLFRADLYYRLAVIPVEIPPLRERPGDIPLLIHYICDKLVSRGYPNDLECDPEAMQLMMNYPWPGNVRELTNAVEHGMILAENGRVTASSLPIDIQQGHKISTENVVPDYKAEQADSHSREILDALARSRGNRAEAARLLGIDRSTLWRRMHRLKLA